MVLHDKYVCMNNIDKVNAVKIILNRIKTLPSSTKTTADWAADIVFTISDNELIQDLNTAIISQKKTIDALNAEIESLKYGGKPEDYLSVNGPTAFWM